MALRNKEPDGGFRAGIVVGANQDLEGSAATVVNSDNSKGIRCKDRVWERREAPIVLVVPPMQQVMCINAKISFCA